MDSRMRSRAAVAVAVAFCLTLIGFLAPESTSVVAAADKFNRSYPSAILDLKVAIVKAFGIQGDDDYKVFGFDLRDVEVGKSVEYKFDVQVNDKVLPFKWIEEVDTWKYVDLPIFELERPVNPGNENGSFQRRQFDYQLPVIAPFQLAGPMELWIQNAHDMRISLPHDVDAGVVKKVILADGAIVTVTGARSVSLGHPVELPLPLKFSSSILNILKYLKDILSSQEGQNILKYLQDTVSSQEGPLLSLRTVGPTSLTSLPPPSNRLKLKRLAAGLVELSCASKKTTTVEADAISDTDHKREATGLLAPNQFGSVRSAVSVNASNSKFLGPKANKLGSLKLLKMDVSAQTLVKMNFGVRKKLKEGDPEWDIPEWRTKPEYKRIYYEVLAKVDGEKLVPLRVVEVEPVIIVDSYAPNVLLGNIPMSKMPITHLPPSPFTL